jgi:hypothetical protein
VAISVAIAVVGGVAVGYYDNSLWSGVGMFIGGIVVVTIVWLRSRHPSAPWLSLAVGSACACFALTSLQHERWFGVGINGFIAVSLIGHFIYRIGRQPGANPLT